MNSALKPVLSSSGPQNPSGASQLNKPMHQQGAPTSYGQPPSHMQPSLVNLPHNNQNAHQNSTAPNHYSLNVPSAPQHYMPSNTTTQHQQQQQPPPPSVPINSNHPVPNVSQSSSTQVYNPPKNVNYSTGYQTNIAHTTTTTTTTTNQNTLPPVSQSLPPSTPVSQPSTTTITTTTQNSLEINKPQSNGTAEQQANYVQVKEKALPPSTTALQVDKSPDKSKTPQPESAESKAVDETNSEVVDNGEKSVPQTVDKPSVDKTENEDVKQKETEVPLCGDSPKCKEPAKTPSPAKVTANARQTSPRKSRTPKLDGETTPKNSKAELKFQQKSSPSSGKVKRQRTRTQPYQSPLPEMEIISKISSSNPRHKNNDEKLIVFYKNEFLAVRNSEGSFYVCRAVQNIYKTSLKIKIRWLSQDKTDKTGEIYTPDFYDTTDFDCILTNLNLNRVDKGKFRLPPAEKERTDSILKRSLAVEKGEVTSPSLTEEHPDGLDLSLYTEESQLNQRKGTKRKPSAGVRAGRKAKTSKLSPDQAKVRKTVTKSVKKTRKSLQKVQTTSGEGKKQTAGPAATSVASSRAGRAKKRSENNKNNPVVDQKKAKVLAKVARKSAVKAVTTKGGKSTKQPATTSKTKSPTTAALATKTIGTRKTKRSTRK